MAIQLNENQLIEFIARREVGNISDSGLILGIGDDAAIIRPTAGYDLVTCTDTLVAGVHFPEVTSAYDIGWKSLAVNLSDLAAMGAKPLYAQLALTLPQANSDWLEAFLDGWFALAHQYQVQLIGGDTSRGPLSITVQAMGEVPEGEALLRAQAQAGDLLVVSGELGGAALALQYLQVGRQVDDSLLQSLNRPQPRLQLGEELRSLASSAIDISDGLSVDLPRLLGDLGATVKLDDLPVPNVLTKLPDEVRWPLAISGGDDYELLFTIPKKSKLKLQTLAEHLALPLAVIGEVQATAIVEFRVGEQVYQPTVSGYQHFENQK